MKAQNREIQEWFSDIRDVKIVLPRFQRFEAWRYSQVEGLVENILRDPALPIGAMLTLAHSDTNKFVAREIVGGPKMHAEASPTYYLLDGQQRLTALWRSLNDDYTDAKFFVSLDEKAESADEEIEIDAPEVKIVKRRQSKSGVLSPAWADSAQGAFEKKLVPLSILCPGADGEARRNQWKSDLKVLLVPERFDEYEAVTSYVSKLRERIGYFNIPYLSLGANTGANTAIEVFVNMNTSFTKLDDFDIVVAQTEGAHQSSLHDMVADLKEAVPGLAAYGRTNNYILSISALLTDQKPIRATFMGETYIEALPTVWDQVVYGARHGTEFLRNEGMLNEKSVPSEIIVYLTCALFGRLSGLKTDQLGNARSILRKAIWRAAFSNRYEKTASTRAFKDFNDISSLILQNVDATQVELFGDDAELPEILDLQKAGWPGKKDRLARAILCTGLRRGARDLADGSTISRQNYSERHLHHIFPVKMLGGDRADDRVNKALNCALVTGATNQMFSATAPAIYLQDRIERAVNGEGEIVYRLKSHIMPGDPNAYADYETFLQARAGLVMQDMLALCDGNEP